MTKRTNLSLKLIKNKHQEQFYTLQQQQHSRFKAPVNAWNFYAVQNMIIIPKANILIVNTACSASSYVYFVDIVTGQIINTISLNYQIIDMKYHELSDKIVIINSSSILLTDPYTFNNLKSIQANILNKLQIIEALVKAQGDKYRSFTKHPIQDILFIVGASQEILVVQIIDISQKKFKILFQTSQNNQSSNYFFNIQYFMLEKQESLITYSNNYLYQFNIQFNSDFSSLTISQTNQVYISRYYDWTRYQQINSVFISSTYYFTIYNYQTQNVSKLLYCYGNYYNKKYMIQKKGETDKYVLLNNNQVRLYERYNFGTYDTTKQKPLLSHDQYEYYGSIYSVRYTTNLYFVKGSDSVSDYIMIFPIYPLSQAEKPITQNNIVTLINCNSSEIFNLTSNQTDVTRIQTIQLSVQIDSSQGYLKTSQHNDQRQSVIELKIEKDQTKNLHTNNSQAHQFHKSNSKSKQLQNSETINWLKKRYLGKANQEYILNQDQNHESSKQIINIYKDLTNDSRNHSKENTNQENKKLLVEDVCEYLQKNDINISKKQLTELLSKKGQQKKEQIGLDDFERIMMSQTLNDQFKKCLKTQDKEQQLVNQLSKRKSKDKVKQVQLSSHLQANPFYIKLSSMKDLHENVQQDNQEVNVIHQKQNYSNGQNNNNKVNKSFIQKREYQITNSNRIKSNIELDQAKFNITQKGNTKHEQITNSRDDGKQNYQQNFEIQTETERKNRNKSLKNLMNQIHFQIKRQQIIEQFHKIKTSQKAKASEKYSILESLLKLPKYQINRYKQSDPIVIKNIEQDIQVQKTEVPLFLTQSGQLESLQNINFEQNNLSPKNIQANHKDFEIQVLSENKQYYLRDNNDQKNNQKQFIQNEKEEVEIADSQNDDEEEYELQMLVERAKYKAKKQFKNEISKANDDIMNLINKEKFNTLSTKRETLDTYSNKKHSTQITTNLRSSYKKNTIQNSAINSSVQKINTCGNNRNIRAYSLNQKNNQLKQIESQNYIQMLDESNDNNNNNYYRISTKQDFTPIKQNQNTLICNSSTKDYQNQDIISKTEGQKQSKLTQNNNGLINNQHYQLPQINQTNTNSRINHSNVNMSGFQNMKNQNENNSIEQPFKNQVTRRKFVSVFNKIHNQNNNISKFNNTQNQSNSTSVTQSIQNTNSYVINQPEYDVKNIYKQMNLIKDNDNFSQQNSKILFQKMTANNQVLQEQQKFSHCLLQESSIQSQNTLENNDHYQNQNLKTLSNHKTNTSRTYKNAQNGDSSELKYNNL
ncbi:hypothetical protein ABPG72_016654 [Tetrahymena utriculariae]